MCIQRGVLVGVLDIKPRSLVEDLEAKWSPNLKGEGTNISRSVSLELFL
jgi:hypothetical protein